MSREYWQLGTSMMHKIDVLYNAGLVKRLHTVPTVGHHTVGQHVYGSQIIAVELCGVNLISSHHVMLALLGHDGAETMTGDIPAPIKRAFPETKVVFDKMEDAFNAAMGMASHALSPLEEDIVKACDTLDLMMNCIYERRLGNRHNDISVMFNNCMLYLEKQHHVKGVVEILGWLVKEWHWPYEDTVDGQIKKMAEVTR